MRRARAALAVALAFLASCGGPSATPVAQRPPNLAPAQFANTSQCLSALFSAGATFRKIDDFRDDRGCGISRAITLIGAGNGTAVAPATDIKCDMAYAFTDYVARTVQPEAMRLLGQPVARIHHYGSYNCKYRAPGRLSEHAKGNAIDISAFELADGSMIRVGPDWRGSGVKTTYLRSVANRACNHVSLVLGPSHDHAHRNHLHLDLGEWALCDP